MAIGGSAAFFTSGLQTLGWAAFVRWMKLKVNGGIMTVAGFSFFG